MTRYWSEWESQHPDKRCLLSSKFEHEGHFYCQRHAALLALGKMLRDGELDGAGKSAAG